MAYTEEQRASLSLRRGQAAAGIKDPAARKAFIALQGESERTEGPGADEGLEMGLAHEKNRQALEGSASYSVAREARKAS